MLAIRQAAFGGPEQLRLDEVPDPHPADGEVRIRVESAGVHLLDTVIRRGGGGPRVATSLPMTPGREVAGIVDEVGAGVDTGLIGRRIVADLGLASGGYAELAVAPSTAVHLLPDDVDADSAVAMVGTGRTTMAILELAAPDAGDVVLVTAAAGGIGTLLVQACRAAGAKVVGAAGGPGKVALVRRLGADHAVDYSVPDWPDAIREALDGGRLTLALDGVGSPVGRSALELLGPAGRLVMFGSSSGSLTELSAADLFSRGISAASAVGARILERPGGTRTLERDALRALNDRRLQPVIGQRFALADAPAAHAALESRATTGKTILRP
ncbi:zinc-binding dehydrogenase [Actinomadura madurae]|nr:zinc-binding dehydrogenase [Actinomadura madurae]MCP9972277.1 zinc-binding dehydrogenase [Actinomadura madurae]MCP9984783.1 zinc-binding dehydrogenase [Actinomadura madurae]MCQ0020972.1 zinc-binding dehydrogenase [Actinomadura madurae]